MADEQKGEERVTLVPGQLVGNYRILGSLARGGMGEIFSAVHQYIERRAAIKVLYPSLSHNPHFTSRFLNEARAVNLVQHPGLVEIFEFGLLPDGAAYLVMELLTGESLARRMQREPSRPVEWVRALGRQIALALAAAHREGIVHRDLKPDNVMLVPGADSPLRERVKILDFGIAKVSAPTVTPPGVVVSGDGARSRTRSGMALGTPEYMSPEQCTGGAIDGKADVYALGVLLFELLSGKLPFRADLAFDLMAMHVRMEAPPLRAVAPQVSAADAELVASMLAKDPAERPTMAQVALLLDDGAAVLMQDRPLTPAEREAQLPRLPAEPSGPPPEIDLGDQTTSATSIPRSALPTPSGKVASRSSVPEPRRRRILVVDDEPSLVRVMLVMLESHGYEVRTLPDGLRVLDEVRAFTPDLVILDVELPGKTGYKLCWEIKSNPATASTLVMFLSGRALDDDHKLGMAMKADAYMDKPFQVPQLLSLIELLLAPLGPAPVVTRGQRGSGPPRGS